MKIQTFASGSTGNLHLLKFNQSNVLLECGLPFSQIRKHLGPIMPNACLLTHYHGDHSKSAQKVMEAGVNLYCTKPTADHLELDHFRIKIIYPGEWVKLDGFRFISFPTNHDVSGAVCFLIDIEGHRVLFATDTGTLPYEFPGMTEIIVECNHLESIIEQLEYKKRARIQKTHMGLIDCIDFLERNDLTSLNDIRLIHLSSRNADSKVFKTEVQKVSGKPVYIS
ncbi:MBL fold metallo-hydrolase [Candidatus Pacearchaeota archaeon]|nr:MBL fold metallo-hydrolase [Candidatus Pacearchaeota archaeon]